MEDNNRQPWLLIAIASLGLVLGVVALIIAFNAKSASNDAASQNSVDQVSTELSNLIDRLGIAEQSLKGQQQTANGKAKAQARESRDAVINMSNRIDRVEARVNSLNASSKQVASLNKRVNNLTQQVGALSSQVSSTDAQVKSLNQRVNRLSNQAHSSSGGGQAAP